MSAVWRIHKWDCISNSTRKTVWYKHVRNLRGGSTGGSFLKLFYPYKILSLFYMIPVAYKIFHCLSANHNPELKCVICTSVTLFFSTGVTLFLHWCCTFSTGVTLFALVLHFLRWCYTFFALVLHFLHWCYTFCTDVTLFVLVLHILHWCYTWTALLSANGNWVIL